MPFELEYTSVSNYCVAVFYLTLAAVPLIKDGGLLRSSAQYKHL